MGEKLLKYYDFAKEKGGIQAQMRLAMKTTIPSSKAGATPDSPELLKKFQDVLKDIFVNQQIPRY